MEVYEGVMEVWNAREVVLSPRDTVLKKDTLVLIELLALPVQASITRHTVSHFGLWSFFSKEVHTSLFICLTCPALIFCQKKIDLINFFVHSIHDYISVSKRHDVTYDSKQRVPVSCVSSVSFFWESDVLAKNICILNLWPSCPSSLSSTVVGCAGEGKGGQHFQAWVWIVM